MPEGDESIASSRLGLFERLFRSFERFIRPIEMIAVCLACVTFVWQCSDRDQERNASLWQIVNQNKGGIVHALEFLNSKKVSLANIDISNRKLNGIQLEGADLRRAKLNLAYLRPKVDIQKDEDIYVFNAYIEHMFENTEEVLGKELLEKYFRDSCNGLSNATSIQLVVANMADAIIVEGELSHAKLTCANLKGTKFLGSDLSNADLRGASLNDADFRCADLTGAKLDWSNFGDADFSGAVLIGVQGTEGQLKDRGCVRDEKTKMLCDSVGREQTVCPSNEAASGIAISEPG